MILHRFRVVVRETEWGWEGAVLLDANVCFTTGHQPDRDAAYRVAHQWVLSLIGEIQDCPKVTVWPA